MNNAHTPRNQSEPIGQRTGADRRQSPRLVVPLKLFFRVEREVSPIETSVENISRTGVSFFLPQRLNTGDRFDINIFFTDDKKVQAQMQIVGSTAGKFGILHRANIRFRDSNTNGSFLNVIDSLAIQSKVSDRRTDGRTASPKALSVTADTGAKANEIRHKAIERLGKSVQDLFSLLSLKENASIPFFHKTMATVHEISAQICVCEALEIPKEEITNRISLARKIHGNSPFLSRLQTWPRGYPGDFETIDYLVNQKNHCDKGTIEYVLEEMGLGSVICQQHRNKLQYQADLILREIVRANTLAVDSQDGPVILILASGSGRDVSRIVDIVRHMNFRLVLNDFDNEALNRAREELAPIQGRCEFVQGNALMSIAKLSMRGPYDLILAGGLFDYLNERQANFLLTKIRARLLRPTGKLVFTNIAAGNPYRPWLEYILDWHLIERSETDVTNLCIDAGFLPDDVTVGRDPSNLTILTEICAREAREDRLNTSQA